MGAIQFFGNFVFCLRSLSLPQALQIVNQQRKAHGLRYNDYIGPSSSLCRKHCTNRAHRLCSTLKMTNRKAREFKELPPIISEKEGQVSMNHAVRSIVSN